MPHTLFHYKSFERLFIARLGPSIKAHAETQALVESGGATITEQASSLVPLVHEANEMQRQLHGGGAVQYELRLEHEATSLGYSRIHTDSASKLLVYEVGELAVGGPPMNPADFLELVYVLRISASRTLSNPIANSVAIDQWLALGVVRSDILLGGGGGGARGASPPPPPGASRAHPGGPLDRCLP